MISIEECPDWAANGRVVVFDTETTGLSNDDEIVQIAAVEYTNGVRTRDFSLYVTPSCPMNPAAEEVHGLSTAFLAEHGVPPIEALEKFFAFLGDGALLVGHNIRFDMRMLKSECQKFGFAADLDALACCDTILLARQLMPDLPSHRLGVLIEALGLVGENSHDALDDTLACGALFFDLAKRISLGGDQIYVAEF